MFDCTLISVQTDTGIEFNIAYDRRHRIPAWTAEHLTAANLRSPPSADGSKTKGGGDRGNSTFKEDQTIPPMFRAKLVDYFRSGYGSFFGSPSLIATVAKADPMREQIGVIWCQLQMRNSLKKPWTKLSCSVMLLLKWATGLIVIVGPGPFSQRRVLDLPQSHAAKQWI